MTACLSCLKAATAALQSDIKTGTEKTLMVMMMTSQRNRHAAQAGQQGAQTACRRRNNNAAADIAPVNALPLFDWRGIEPKLYRQVAASLNPCALFCRSTSQVERLQAGKTPAGDHQQRKRSGGVPRFFNTCAGFSPGSRAQKSCFPRAGSAAPPICQTCRRQRAPAQCS